MHRHFIDPTWEMIVLWQQERMKRIKMVQSTITKQHSYRKSDPGTYQFFFKGRVRTLIHINVNNTLIKKI